MKMNNMKKAIALLSLMILALTLLVSCGETDEVPGMTLISKPTRDGYYFYLPEEYTVDRSSGIPVGYLSELDRTSISCYLAHPSEATVADYVAANLDRDSLGTDFLMETEASAMTVGGKDAFTYVYSFLRGEVGYRVMQVYIPLGETPAEGVVILTYTGTSTASVTGLVGYTKHLSDFEKVIQVFKFTEVTDTAPEATRPPITDGAPDGMQLASDPEISNYFLYIPLTWKIDIKAGISMSYVESDKTSLSVTSYYPESGVASVATYVDVLLEEYKGFFDKCELIPTGELDEDGKPIYFVAYEPDGVGGFPAFRYEFTAEKDGVCYRFSRVIIFKNKGLLDSGLYSLVLSAHGESEEAASDLLSSHEEEFASILSHFRFD